MIQDFFTKYFAVTRPSWSTDEEGNSFSTLVETSSFYGHIQQAQAEDTQSLGLTLTKPFVIWCDLDTDILEGDTIQSVDGYYSVKAIKKLLVGANKHLRIVVQEDEIIGS